MSIAGQSSSPFGAFIESPLHARNDGDKFIIVTGDSAFGMCRYFVDESGPTLEWQVTVASTSFGHPCVDGSNVYCSTIESSGQLGIRAYDLQGNHLWTWSDANPTGGAVGYLRTFVRNGYVYGCGHEQIGATFDPYLVKLNKTTGAVEWEVVDAGADRETSHGLWVTSDDVVYVCVFSNAASKGYVVTYSDAGAETGSVDLSPLKPTDIWELSSGDFIVGGTNLRQIARITAALGITFNVAGGENIRGLVMSDDESEVYASSTIATSINEAQVFSPTDGSFIRKINLSAPSISLYLDKLDGAAYLLCRPSGAGTYPNQELFRLDIAADPITVTWASNITSSTVNSICSSTPR